MDPTADAGPMFSVVLPTYNRADRIVESIECVLAVEFDSFELIVVNDGSTDHTAEVLASLADERVKVVTRENGGISAARNTGVDAASGRYVVTIDDDDIPGPHWLAEFARIIDSTGASVVSAACVVFDEDTGAEIEWPTPTPLGPIFSDYEGLYLAGTFAVDRQLYRSIGGFAEGLQCSHQTEFAIRLLRHCREHDLIVASSREAVVRIARRPAADRPESSPAKLYSGTKYLLAHHWDQFATAPSSLANYHAIVGVNAVKLGHMREGRAYLWRAWRLNPRRPRHALRAAVASVPPVARRVWRG